MSNSIHFQVARHINKRLHFPGFLVVTCGHVTVFWLIRCGWKYVELSGRSHKKSLTLLGSVSLFPASSLLLDVCNVHGNPEAILGHEVTEDSSQMLTSPGKMMEACVPDLLLSHHSSSGLPTSKFLHWRETRFYFVFLDFLLTLTDRKTLFSI